MKKIISLFLIVAFFASCSEYQKALKTEDVAVKFEMATKLYDAGKYNDALDSLSKLHLHIAENLRRRNYFICFQCRIIKRNNII